MLLEKVRSLPDCTALLCTALHCAVELHPLGLCSALRSADLGALLLSVAVLCVGFVFFVLCVAAVVLIGAAAYWVIQRGRRGELLDDEKWHTKKQPLVNGKHVHTHTHAAAEEDEYEEYDDEDGDEYEDGEEEEYEEQQVVMVEEHKQPAHNNKGYVTSTDVARMVTSQPTASKAKRPVQIA